MNRSSVKASQQSLAKRLLFPTLPTNDLPPLLHTKDVPPELTSELYDFIALALRAFVNPWWTKITRYDKEFLPEITHIISYVIASLEKRVLCTDLAPLVYKDIPLIIAQHYRDYRNAASKLSTSYACGGALTLAQLFHQLQPHMALTADGQIDPDYFRQIVDHILKECLPREDFTPETERTIIREIILKIVLTDVLPNVSQPWFINKIILDQLGSQSMSFIPVHTTPILSNPLSFHSILVLILSGIQTVSGTCLALINAYKQAMNTIKLVNQSTFSSSLPEDNPTKVPPPPVPAPRLSKSDASSIALSDPLSFSPPSSISSNPSSAAPLFSHPNSLALETDIPSDYAFPALIAISEVFSTHERFSSNTVINTLTMLVYCFSSFLDKLLPFILYNILSANFVLGVIRLGKRTLFPNGYPGPPPTVPTPEEQAETLNKLLAYTGNGTAAGVTQFSTFIVQRRKFLIASILPLLLGPDMPSTVAAALDPLSNAPCNVHLVMMILDCVFATLFPELKGTMNKDE